MRTMPDFVVALSTYLVARPLYRLSFSESLLYVKTGPGPWPPSTSVEYVFILTGSLTRLNCTFHLGYFNSDVYSKGFSGNSHCTSAVDVDLFLG
jgi:hypothetical protein